jgi:citrate lyase beta subunit
MPTTDSQRSNRASRYLAVRSVLETPIMDERKWAKVPSIPADALLLDLEDAVPPAHKGSARDKVASLLRDPSYLNGRIAIARPNHLSSAWGHDDVVALAEAGVTCMAYPKIGVIDDLLEVIELLASHNVQPDIFAIIETPGAIMDIRKISEHPQVVALMFGPGDMSVGMGIPLFEPDGSLNRVFDSMKSQSVVTASAAGIAITDIVFAPNFRDLEEVRRRAEHSKMLGFSALSTFYPPHVDIINDIFTTSEAEIAVANALVETYEALRADGRPAALGERGETILVHDYEKALGVLARQR